MPLATPRCCVGPGKESNVVSSVPLQRRGVPLVMALNEIIDHSSMLKIHCPSWGYCQSIGCILCIISCIARCLSSLVHGGRRKDVQAAYCLRVVGYF